MISFIHCMRSTLSANTRGIILALVSNALFVVAGACVRYLSETLDVFQILLFRQLIFIAVLIPAISGNMGLLVKPRLVGLHTLRVVAAFFALFLGFVTVSNMPLAEATALGFTKVLFVALLSAVFLKEAVNRSRRLVLVVGFIGVLLVVQPSYEKMTFLYTFAGLGSALSAAVAVFCVRKIARTEPTITLLAYQALFVGLLALIPCLFTWHRPTSFELTLLVLVGVISTAAQWFGVTAYKFGEANVVANVEYTQMPYSLLLGYYFFSEPADVTALVGAAMIITSVFLPHLCIQWPRRPQKAFIAKNNPQ